MEKEKEKELGKKKLEERIKNNENRKDWQGGLPKEKKRSIESNIRKGEKEGRNNHKKKRKKEITKEELTEEKALGDRIENGKR